jgi:two-component system chemotaxis family response regulator WspR
MSSDLILPGELLPSLGKPPFVILLVDDRPFIAEAIQSLLRDESDISLHYCSDPFKSLEMAEKINPTVILLDVIMPDMDGFTLCRFFRAHPRTRDKPVIMLSGSDEPPVKAQAFAAGASDYLVKLPDKIELIARLRYHSLAYLNKMERDKAAGALQTCQVKIEHLHGQVTKLTRHDILTGLSNRNAFEERCNEMWNLAMRNNIPISLIMMNLDYFTLFNEHYGHPRGDESIKAITQVFRQTIRRLSDVLARFSDEKFIALLPATQAEGAVHLAESVRSGVEKLGIPHSKSEVARHLTISLGVASATPMRGANVGALLKLSEDCLSRSKELGRNRFHVAHLPED